MSDTNRYNTTRWFARPKPVRTSDAYQQPVEHGIVVRFGSLVIGVTAQLEVVVMCVANINLNTNTPRKALYNGRRRRASIVNRG